ncbi:MAG TPA: dienelactone hydrolase family protein [Pseudonocardiaceae bacterium]|nr:dienelactone hydrolase family protein [Pseudonocardiaceae bacterium]
MPRTGVTVPTKDGACAATIHTPSAVGSWPAVIFYPDAGGPRETIAGMADRLAGLGYTVLVPNVFYRAGEYAPFDFATVFSVPAERERLMSLDTTPSGSRRPRPSTAGGSPPLMTPTVLTCWPIGSAPSST